VKKLINSPDTVVDEALAGLAAAHADLLRLDRPNIVVRRDAPRPGKAGLVAGGGSGHEPMQVGYVGVGGLDAACPGNVFTSPVPDQILAATKAVSSGAGVLHVVLNYTGDIMNFEIGAELAEAEGIAVRTVVIADDVAVEDSTFTAGRRGVGGVVLADKITGAMAEAGASIDEIVRVCRKVQDNVRTMGMALSSCTVPAAGRPTFEIGDDEMEIGMGVHGEPGRRRMKIATADDVVEMLALPVIEDLPFRAGDRVLAFVNGFGATPLIELYVMYHSLARLLDGRGIAISRNLVGNYITSLEMAGCSITLLRLDDELVRLWDAPVHTPALRWGM
jgi:phosphoenolpyruvate---glycerone phosphotransferase subunit DhaK